MFKHITLLAMVVGVLVALAAPAIATASPDLVWETGETQLGSNTPGEEVVFHGTLSWTKSALKLSCNATANLDLWNDGTHGAHGEVTSLTLSPDPIGTHGCTVAVNVPSVGYVDVSNCHFEAAPTGLPWTVTTGQSFGDHHLTIDGFSFVTQFTGTGCPGIGIPSGTKVSDTGDATGVATSNGDCITFNNSGTFDGGSTLDGEMCATGDLRLTTAE